MNNLVITVSLDSSIELLKQYADIVALDTNRTQPNDATYGTLYLRSHFSHPEIMPQNFRAEIEKVSQNVKQKNPGVKFIDGMDSVDTIVNFENKWNQYSLFSEFMPHTELLAGATFEFERPVFKNILSSRGEGVTWDKSQVTGSIESWIVQESMDIREELRVYVIGGEVYPTGAIRRSMTTGEQKVKTIGFRELTREEIEFVSKISKKLSTLDMIGLDVARTSGNVLKLLEVNRSPDFAAFAKLTGTNLASILYCDQS